MKRIHLLVCLTTLACLGVKAQTSNKYDSVLAKKLNADPYGMKRYVLVMLKTGPASKTATKALQDSIFKGHMKNIQQLSAEGKLVMAGPLSENDKNYEGVFVFNSQSLDDTRKLLQTDPAVKSKLLDADLFVWYSSAAIMEIPGIHEKIQKMSF